jgi:hypothetical protein
MEHVWVNVRLVNPITGKEIETKALVDTGAKHKSLHRIQRDGISSACLQ